MASAVSDLPVGSNMPGRKHRPAWEAQKERAFARRERMKGVGLAAISSAEKVGLGIGNGKCAAHPTADDFDSVRRMAHEALERQPPGGSSLINLSDGTSDAVTSVQPAPWRDSANVSCLPQQNELQQVNGYGGGQRPLRRQVGLGDAATGQQAYAQMLAAQVEEKRLMKEAERKRYLSADHADREAAELRANVASEVNRQRQREATVQAREDSLARFMAENQGSSSGARVVSPQQRPRRMASRPPSMPSQRNVDALAEPSTNLCGNPPPERVSSNVWATGANQNCGNFISERATSRVLRPPGGGSSFQLGQW